MAKTVEKTVTPFYCDMALKLCVQARQLCALGNCRRRVEICRFISTLCKEKNEGTCREESGLCSKVAEICEKNQKRSDSCGTAEEICIKARILCPHNYVIHGG